MRWQPMITAPLDRPVDLVIDGRHFENCVYYPIWGHWGRKVTRKAGGVDYEADLIFTSMPEPSAWAEPA